jgi:phosphate transport system protein
MIRHLQREIETIKRKLLALCAVVEKNVAMATKAIAEQDAEMARTVIEDDRHVDRLEVELEEDCLKILALYQPVAVDLRAIVAVLKINNDLERIGDLAVNVAERAGFLASRPAVPEPFDFDLMADKVRAMLRNAVDAFIESRSQAAHEVCKADDEVDAINSAMYKSVESMLRREDADVGTLIHLLSVSRDLERIADHATNIAEDVIYMISGEIVRHHVEDYTKE